MSSSKVGTLVYHRQVPGIKLELLHARQVTYLLSLQSLLLETVNLEKIKALPTPTLHMLDICNFTFFFLLQLVVLSTYSMRCTQESLLAVLRGPSGTQICTSALFTVWCLWPLEPYIHTYIFMGHNSNAQGNPGWAQGALWDAGGWIWINMYKAITLLYTISPATSSYVTYNT